MVSVKKVVASFLVVIALKKMVDRISAQRRHHRLLDRAESKRKQRDTQISGEFTPAIDIPEEISSLILNATVNDLLNLLNEDRITSEQILRVYHNRAITIGLKLELIAESNFKEALELAKQCDETRKNTPKEERSKLGSMFGIPISIKDSIEQKNLDSTCGLAKNCFEPCAEDAGVIKLLKAQGAIPFIRTNTSQALRALDCSNHIWGRGLNPWCVHRSVGGSSGGDGGLIASKCSPVGFGSDVYGSIRLPAAFNGICGFKPTSGRYAASGHTLIARQDIMKFSLLLGNMGPLGRCVQDLVQVVKGLITPESGIAPYIPWDEEKYQSKSKLKIGYIVSEDFFGASKACKRAVKEAVLALEKLGYETVEIKIPNFEEISLSVISLLAAEGKAQSVKDALAGEKPTSDLELFTDIGTLPNFAKKFTKIFASERISKIISRTIHLSTNKFMLEMSRLQIMKGQVLQNWAEMKLDAIVTPATALPAWKHGYGSKLIPSTSYLWIANVVNLPSGIVPVTKVRPGEDTYEVEDSVYNKDVLFRYSQECMQGSVGLPVGVQVLSMPWEDEKCLSVMKAIEASIEPIKLPDIK